MVDWVMRQIASILAEHVMWRVRSCVVGLSVVLLVTTVAVWAKSYYPPSYRVQQRRWDRVISLQCTSGYVDLSVITDPSRLRLVEDMAIRGEWDLSTFVVCRSLPRAPRWPEIAPTVFRWFSVSRKSGWLIVRIPVWCVALLFAIFPAFVAVTTVRGSKRRQHRLKAGLCAQCGYDLRGVRERCPECGFPFQAVRSYDVDASEHVTRSADVVEMR